MISFIFQLKSEFAKISYEITNHSKLIDNFNNQQNPNATPKHSTDDLAECDGHFTMGYYNSTTTTTSLLLIQTF